MFFHCLTKRKPIRKQETYGIGSYRDFIGKIKKIEHSLIMKYCIKEKEHLKIKLRVELLDSVYKSSETETND